jgi:tripartite-type tricarboxylate transporter receptor subunit TctC
LPWPRPIPASSTTAPPAPGNLTHVSGELFKVRAGIDFVAIQYKSSAEFITALVGGQVDFAFDNVTSLRALIDEGKLRALAVTSAERQADFPNVPTMIEAGVRDYVVTAFFGVVAPAGTPPAIIARVNAVINDGLKTEALRESLKKLGAQATIETPEQFAAFIAAEMQKWTEIASVAGIKVD